MWTAAVCCANSLAVTSHPTLAAAAVGLDRITGPAILIGVPLLVAGWTMPLMTVKRLVFLSDRVSLLGALIDLWTADQLFLFLIVAVFSVIFPAAKLLVASYVWYLADTADARLPRIVGWLSELAKWSMLDVFVVALPVELAATSQRRFSTARKLTMLSCCNCAFSPHCSRVRMDETSSCAPAADASRGRLDSRKSKSMPSKNAPLEVRYMRSSTSRAPAPESRGDRYTATSRPPSVIRTVPARSESAAAAPPSASCAPVSHTEESRARKLSSLSLGSPAPPIAAGLSATSDQRMISGSVVARLDAN